MHGLLRQGICGFLRVAMPRPDGTMVPLRELSAVMRDRRTAAQQDANQIVNRIVTLPVTASTARWALADAREVKPLPLVPRPPATGRAAAPCDASEPGFRQRLVQRTQVKQPIATRIPTRLHVHRVAFDVDAADAAVAQFDFATTPNQHLTFKVPMFPSATPLISAQADSTRTVTAKAQQLRHEMHYLAQAVDAMIATPDGQELGSSAAELRVARADGGLGFATGAMMRLRGAATLIHEVARVVSPLCTDMASLLIAVEDTVTGCAVNFANGVEQLAKRARASEEARVATEASMQTTLVQVAELRQAIDRIKASQDREAESFISEVAAQGLVPLATNASVGDHSTRMQFSLEQTNAVSSAKMYEFSAERVVPGKVFARHPKQTADVGVDCTDLYFEMPNSAPSAAAPVRRKASEDRGVGWASDAADRDDELAGKEQHSLARIKFRGSMFVPRVFRVVNEDVVKARVAEHAAAVPSPEHDDASQVQPSPGHASMSLKRRGSIRKKSGMMSSVMKKAESSKSSPKQSPTKRPEPLQRTATFAKQQSFVIASRAGSFGPGFASGVFGESRSRTDSETQTAAIETADAELQVVEADIDRKNRRRKANKGATERKRSSLAAADTLDSGTATPTIPTTPNDTDELPGAVHSDAAKPREIVPVVDVAVNTDEQLAGYDLLTRTLDEIVCGRTSEAVSDSARTPPSGALADRTKAKAARGEKNHGATFRSGLPKVFLEKVDNAAETCKPHSLQWLNTVCLEFVKHLDPKRLEAQQTGIPDALFSHFRGKYGLGGLWTSYCATFLFNLKLHAPKSMRAKLLCGWLGLWEYVGFGEAEPECFTREALYCYVYAVQTLVRFGTHKQHKEFEAAELPLSAGRIEYVCDAVLRGVAATYDSADDFEHERRVWLSIMFSSVAVPPILLATISQWRAAADQGPMLDALTARTDLPKGAVLDADVAMGLLVVNYDKLKSAMRARAEMVYDVASAEAEQAGQAIRQTADYGFVEEALAPPPMILARMAPWPMKVETAETENDASEDEG